MANAVTWWSDSSSSHSGSLPGHFSSPALGAPRTPRRRTSDVVIPIEPPIALAQPDPRMAETAECASVRARKTTFRAGASIEAKSSVQSLFVFVVIGLAVGLFAFAMMSLCLPDPGQEIAARAAKKELLAAMTPVPPVATGATEAPAPAVAEAAPVVAEAAPVVAEAAPVVAEAAPVVAEAAPAPPAVLTAKTARAHRRAAKAKRPALPANPYAR